MTREEAKQNLIALGIEEPTDAQVTNYLNQFHSNRPAPAPNPNPAPKPEHQPQPTPAPVPNPQPNQNPSPQNDDEIEKLRKQIDSLQKENIKKTFGHMQLKRSDRRTGRYGSCWISGQSGDCKSSNRFIVTDYRRKRNKSSTSQGTGNRRRFH